MLARGKKQARSFKQAVERWAGRRIDWAARVDIAAVRASIRRARVEDEVEKRVAARTGADRLLRITEEALQAMREHTRQAHPRETLPADADAGAVLKYFDVSQA